MIRDLAWWGEWAAFLLAQTAIIGGVAAVVVWKLRAPQARRAVWQAALIALACVWLGEIAGVGERMRSFGGSESVTPILSGSVTTTSQDVATDSPAVARVAVQPGAPPASVRWPGTLWLAGSLVWLARAATNRWWLARERRKMAFADAETQETVARLRLVLRLSRVEARIWPGLRGPVAFGWWRPTVSLPVDFVTRFTTGQREAILAHELAHLAARDPLWLGLADAICAIAWWNPLVWWGAAQLRAASEAAADEASALTPAGPAALAESLLRFGRDLAEPGLARGLGVAGNGFRSGLGRRVKVLMERSGTWRELPWIWRWSPRILALAFVAALTAVPIISGPSGSVLDLFAQSAEAQGNFPNQPSQNHERSRVYSVPTNFPGMPTVKVKLATVPEGKGNTAQKGLDALFPSLPATDASAGPAEVEQFLNEEKVAHRENMSVDYYRTEDEAAILTPTQFKYVEHVLDSTEMTDVLTMPKAAMKSKGETLLAVQDATNIVTGIAANYSLPPKSPEAYFTDGMLFGVTTTIKPNSVGDGWKLSVLSRLSEFLGYDGPNSNTIKANASGAKPISYVVPQPHLRVAETKGEGFVPTGQTLALRGPAFSVTNVVKDSVLGLFHRTHQTISRERLYVFVTPQAPGK